MILISTVVQGTGDSLVSTSFYGLHTDYSSVQQGDESLYTTTGAAEPNCLNIKIIEEHPTAVIDGLIKVP